MMHEATEERRAFSHWLRTGQWPVVRVEYKFNPYHDPRNGQFTFAPGGPHSFGRVVISDRRPQRRKPLVTEARTLAAQARPELLPGATGSVSPAVYRPDKGGALFIPAAAPRGGPPRPGGNIEAVRDLFWVPMTLQQTFPGLRGSPASAIIALADNVLDFSGPANALTTELSREWSNGLINDIRAIDPSYRLDSLGFPETLEGQMNQINNLRIDRAAAYYRVRQETRPLQVETLRFVQARTDRAYEIGTHLYNEGKLDVRLSREEAIGNFMDREVRRDLRDFYRGLQISMARGQQVRVNSREYDTSGSDSTYRQPDARVGNVVFD